MINPGCVVLLSTAWDGKPNVMTLAWHMPVSSKPPLLAVAVAQKHLTAEYIKSSKEFVINIPGLEMLPQVQYCGSISGRKEDKFSASGLTAKQSQKIGAPIIDECLGHIECKLHSTQEAGDHYIFIGEIVAALADPEAFDQTWLYKTGKSKFTIHHLGGTNYIAPGIQAEVKKLKDNNGFSVVEKILI
jgi:flavin reductase (DIM6/NTAB) family NADH-FMN oxidoreductase RutF